MEKVNRDILIKNHTYLINNVDVNQVKDYLYQEQILSKGDIESLEAFPVGTERCSKLLMLLPSRGPQTFQVRLFF